MNILFWNLNRNNIKVHIKRCLIENHIDVAVFSEFDGVDFVELQNEMQPDYQCYSGNGGCNKIILFASKEVVALVRQEQSRYVLYTIELNDVKYIFVGVHLQDRRSSDSAERIETIRVLMNDIRRLERSSKCKNIIIIGDFNANPYDEEMLQMNAFHAVLFKEVIRKSETRKVGGKCYKRLYNPTINFLSESTKNYGSYYYSEGSSTPVWHCLDQLLVSKTLIDNINDLKYIKTIGNKSLIRRFVPNSTISDHLPLFVQIS